MKPKNNPEFDFSCLLTIAACDERLAALAAKKWGHYEHGQGKAKREAIALKAHRKRIRAALQQPLDIEASGHSDGGYVPSDRFKILNSDSPRGSGLRQDAVGRCCQAFPYCDHVRVGGQCNELPPAVEEAGGPSRGEGQEHALSSPEGIDTALFNSRRIARHSPVSGVSLKIKLKNVYNILKKILTYKIC